MSTTDIVERLKANARAHYARLAAVDLLRPIGQRVIAHTADGIFGGEITGRTMPAEHYMIKTDDGTTYQLQARYVTTAPAPAPRRPVASSPRLIKSEA
jgi:hypothetical protein